VNVTYFAMYVVPRHDDRVLVRGEPAEVTPEGKLVKTGTNHIIVSLVRKCRTTSSSMSILSVFRCKCMSRI
jgi:hypothetical protein